MTGTSVATAPVKMLSFDAFDAELATLAEKTELAEVQRLVDRAMWLDLSGWSEEPTLPGLGTAEMPGAIPQIEIHATEEGGGEP